MVFNAEFCRGLNFGPRSNSDGPEAAGRQRLGKAFRWLEKAMNEWRVSGIFKGRAKGGNVSGIYWKSRD